MNLYTHTVLLLLVGNWFDGSISLSPDTIDAMRDFSKLRLESNLKNRDAVSDHPKVVDTIQKATAASPKDSGHYSPIYYDDIYDDRDHYEPPHEHDGIPISSLGKLRNHEYDRPYPPQPPPHSQQYHSGDGKRKDFRASNSELGDVYFYPELPPPGFFPEIEDDSGTLILNEKGMGGLFDSHDTAGSTNDDYYYPHGNRVNSWERDRDEAFSYRNGYNYDYSPQITRPGYGPSTTYAYDHRDEFREY